MTEAAKASALVEGIVHAESARAEKLVAWARAAVWGLVALPLIIGRIHVFSSDRVNYTWVLVLFLVLICVASMLYARWLNPDRYRSTYSDVTAVLDVLFSFSVAFGTGLIGGRVGTTLQLLAATPATLMMMFTLSTAALRQSPRASMLAGAIAIAVCATAIVIAANASPPPEIPDYLHQWMSPSGWTIRGILFACVSVVLVLASRSARSMVERAGREMAERTRVMHLFGRYVAPEVRDEVVRGETPAEVRECTVLFTDLRDFTSLAEKVTPRELLDLLNAHFAELIPVVHRHGGTVNKFVGDALMATFGAPIRMADHAAAAVRAGLEMLKATDAMNQQLRASGRPELMMGVGIATGPVVVGNLGALDRQEYAVLGDTVNTAARMESANKETGTRILLSEATAEAVGTAVPLKPLGALKVKGKAGSLAVFTAG